MIFASIRIGVIGLGALVSASMAGCVRKELSVVSDSAVIAEFCHFSEVPISVSPTGDLAAVMMTNTDATFRVELRTRSGFVRHFAESRERLLRLTWSPQGTKLAYFAQDDTTRRRLFFWNISNDVHAPIVVPPTYNQNRVAWDCEGKRLAFTSDSERLIIASEHTEPVVVERAIRAFDWSRDGRFILAILEDSEWKSEVALIEAATGRILRRANLELSYALKSVSWRSEIDAVLCGQIKSENRSCIVFIDAVHLGLERLVQVQGEISDAMRIQGSKRLIWSTIGSDGRSTLTLGTESGVALRSFDYGDINNFRGFVQDNAGMAISAASPDFVGLRIASLSESGDDASAAIAVAPSVGPGGAESSIISLPIGDSFVDIYVTESRLRRDSTKRAVVRMLGGRNPQHQTNWAERQLYILNGVDYISVPNPKPLGAETLLSAVRYARQELGVSPRNIALLAESSASIVVLEALVNDPQCCGVVTIIGLSTPPRLDLRKVEKLPVILAFHGAEDICPPAIGRLLLSQVVGARSLIPPRGLWHEFAGEAHSLGFSMVYVHGTILHQLGASRMVNK